MQNTATLPAAGSRLGPKAAFYLQGSIIVSFLAGSSAPTSLYSAYQASMHFSSLAMTAIFGVYAIGVLLSLLVMGRLSDYIGRRPILLYATRAQGLAMLLFVGATSTPELFLARAVQGLITGAAVAAAGAGMLDIDRQTGGVANAVASPVGTGIGGLLSGVFVQYLPAPTTLIYAVFAIVYLLQMAGLSRMAETASVKPGAMKSLVPNIRMPESVRATVALAVPTLVAIWALAGFYASLGPKLVHSFGGDKAALLGGLALTVFSAAGAVAALLSQRVPHPKMMTASAAATLVGLGVLLVSMATSTVELFMLATALMGVAFGTGLQGAIRSVVEHLAAEERAGVLSVLFVISYLSMGLPAVLAGFRLGLTGDIHATTLEFGWVIAALTSAPLVARLRTSTRTPMLIE